MSRLLFAVAGGVGLALLLFWLLALLVAPPQEDIEMLEMAMPLAMVEAPQAQEAPSEPAPQSEPLPEPPAEPPPTPEPSPLPDSQLALPEPELADIDMPAMELDEPLPPLTEQPPEPQPEPEPEPEPAPDPAPEPTPEPAPEATPDTATAPPAGDIASSDGEAADEPVDVGRVTPTSQVPPEYPARAQRRGMEGFVELEFVIQRDGRVDPESIRVVSANPRNIFDKAALDAVRQWRFDSAERLRQARQRLEFQLR